MRKKVLILCFTDLDKEPRVRRQINALESKFEIITAGYSPVKFGIYQFQKIEPLKEFKLIDFHYNKPLLIRKTVSLFIILKNSIPLFLRKNTPSFFIKTIIRSAHSRNTFKNLSKLSFDAVIAHDVQTLPVAEKLARVKNAKLIFDAHEYAPGEFESNPYWIKYYQKVVIALCRKYLPATDLMFTVCNGIAEEYKMKFGVSSIVITNATDYSDLHPVQTEPEKIKLVHHGAAIAERHLELMIQMMDYLDERFHLYLMLIPNQKDYLDTLKKSCDGNSRIHFIEPVATDKIAERINEFDIGIVFVPPVCLNYKFGLGNKFFEFIQARLMLGLGPLQEMTNIADMYNLGVSSQDFNPRSLANQLNKLNVETIMKYKNNSHKSAMLLSSETNKATMLKLISKLLNDK